MDRKALRPRKIPKSGVKAAARLQKTRKYKRCWVRGWFYPDLKQNLAVGIVWVSLFSGIEIGGVFIHAETHFGGKRDFPGGKTFGSVLRSHILSRDGAQHASRFILPSVIFAMSFFFTLS